MNHLRIEQQVTFLFTRNLAATAQFYEEILGLPLVLDQGSCRIYRICGEAYLGFCDRDEAPRAPAGIIFTLVTPEVDQWFEYLRGQGVEFEQTPILNPQYKIYHCFLRDPNGYLIEIQRFLDPAWPQPAVNPVVG